jgi:hypothetical protein
MHEPSRYRLDCRVATDSARRMKPCAEQITQLRQAVQFDHQPTPETVPANKSSLAAVHDDRGQQLAQDLLRMPGYETKMAAARNHVQSVVRQLRGHILGSRGKDHVIGLAVPDADMRCDVLQ